MAQAPSPTPYADVNRVLADFLAAIRSILGARLVGMYVDGSLALGDFDPASSDIDFVVVTPSALTEAEFAALHALHARFDASDSPWATEVEAMYIPLEALHHFDLTTARWPIVERGGGPLAIVDGHSGWIAHHYIVREYGIVLAGPDPRSLIAPIPPHALRSAMSALAGGEWFAWATTDEQALRKRGPQVYIVRTCCRILYTLAHGAIVSKPVAARWGLATLDARWSAIITQALTWTKDPPAQVPPTADEIHATRALVAYTEHQCRAAAGEHA